MAPEPGGLGDGGARARADAGLPWASAAARPAHPPPSLPAGARPSPTTQPPRISPVDAARARLARCPLTLAFRCADVETRYLTEQEAERRSLLLAAAAVAAAAAAASVAPLGAARAAALLAAAAAAAWLNATPPEPQHLTGRECGLAVALAVATLALISDAGAPPLAVAAGGAAVTVAPALLAVRWLPATAATGAALGALAAGGLPPFAPPVVTSTAWLAGAVTARLADRLRRQCFAATSLAAAAAEQESAEARARGAALAALSAARADAAAKRLAAAKARAASAAQSEFMSLMCHEVRRGRREGGQREG